MNLLLDTVTFLRLIEDSDTLSPAVQTALDNPDNMLYLSAASVWEIAIKRRLGKLTLPRPPESLIPEQRRLRGIESLAITEAATLRLHQLPGLHKDPFDRILACQAIEHEMTIVTPDELLRGYPIRTLW